MENNDSEQTAKGIQEEWEQNVDKAAQVRLGLPLESTSTDIAGEGPKPSKEMREFFENLRKFLERMATQPDGTAKTKAEFDEAVRKKTAEKVKQAKHKEETEFYKQVETSVAVNERGLRIPSLRLKIIKSKDVSLGYWRVNLLKGEKMKIFEKKLARILSLNENINKNSKEITELQNKINELEAQIRGNEGEESLKEKIFDSRMEIKKKVDVVITTESEFVGAQGEFSKYIEEIKQELEKEGKKIRDKWDYKVQNLMNEKYALKVQLHNYNDGESQAIEIAARIHKINSELEKIKDKIICYKSEHSVFIFEHYLGTVSIPALYSYDQIPYKEKLARSKEKQENVIPETDVLAQDEEKSNSTPQKGPEQAHEIDTERKNPPNHDETITTPEAITSSNTTTSEPKELSISHTAPGLSVTTPTDKPLMNEELLGPSKSAAGPDAVLSHPEEPSETPEELKIADIYSSDFDPIKSRITKGTATSEQIKKNKKLKERFLSLDFKLDDLVKIGRDKDWKIVGYNLDQGIITVKKGDVQKDVALNKFFSDNPKKLK